MNCTYTTDDMPLMDVESLLTAEENYRRSVVFLPSHYASDIEAGDFILARSTQRTTEANGIYAQGGLLLVTNVAAGSDGVAGGFVAASVRPLTEDEHETCDECGGEGCIPEVHGADEGGGGTEYLGCEKCSGYGKVAIHG